MRKSTFHKIEDILRDYPRMDDYIRQREEELRYPMQTDDDNVGGGRSNYPDRDQPVRTLITIDEDRRLNGLKREQRIIKQCFNTSDKDTRIIITELYFNRHPRYTLRGLVTMQVVMVSRNRAYQLRNGFIKECADQLGLIDL